MEITGTSGNWERHVAVYAFPFASHPSILLTLVRTLASAAPTVVFSFFNTQNSNRALFSDQLSCDNIRRYDVSDGIPEDYVFVGKPQEDINLFLEVAEEEFRRGVKVAEEDTGLKISCLVVDAFFWFSGDMAEEMNIPWVAFWTAGVCSLSAHFYTDLIRQRIAELKGSTGPEDEISDLIPGLSSVRLGVLPMGVVFGNLDSPFAKMLHKMGRSLARATTVLINSFQELDPDLTKNLSTQLKKVLTIGPINLIPKQSPSLKSDEFSCISWLENQNPRSVAYICFGTVFQPPPHELIELAEALEETKTPFLWSINNDSKNHFPKGFLERINANGAGKVVPWAPQVQVLEHFAVGLFLNHGGWNSVLESVKAGVPMICRPFLGDQPMNSWMVERVWGIGVRIEGGSFTKHGTRCALEQFLRPDGSSNCWNERAEALKDVARKAVGPNGSSNENFNTLVDVINGSIGPEDEISDLIPGLSSVRLGVLPIGVVFGNLDSPFAKMLHKMGRTLARATAVLINSFQELDPDLTKNLSTQLKKVLTIGPINLIPKQNPSLKSDEFSCISWLENQNPRSVAYICFGTVFQPPPHELIELAEALEETRTPFLCSINNDSKNHFPKGFLERISANGAGKVVPWAPQVQVLEHFAVGVFLNHGGWNSVLESVKVGVPMICKPFLGDQPMNSWMVERVWGIGVRIEGGSFPKHGTRCVLEQFLRPGGSSNCWNERAEALKDVARKTIGPNGSSNENFNTLVDVITGTTF